MENDKEDLNAELLNNNSRFEKTSHCCLFYLFCCCWCCKDQKTYSKFYYIEKWRNYLANEQNDKKKLEDPFRILTNLWAHKDVINDLESIRLNPNILISNPIRNDLEFYIPQLCTFLIFGDYEVIEEFLAFLCKACFASFFFAHRIIWFLKSILDVNSDYNQKILDILKIIQTIFMSNRDKKELKSLHIANSDKYIKSLRYNNMMILYNDKDLNQEFHSTQLHEKMKNGRTLINDFSENHYEFTLKNKDNKSKTEFTWDHKINFENIFVNVFEKIDTDKPEFERIEQLDTEDKNLTSFLSNINFIDKLSNICEIIRIAPSKNQQEILQQELKKMNKLLPSNIYIPFLSEKIRNYVIVHIPISETRIFRTKNRAPYMLTFEVIRIDELIFHLNSIRKKSASYNSTFRSNSVQNSAKPSEILKTKKVIDKNNLQIQNLEYDPDNYLKEQDIILSQPVMIKNMKKLGTTKVLKINNNQKIFEDEEEINKFEELDKKTRVTISYHNFNLKSNKEKDFNTSDNIFKRNCNISINEYKRLDESYEIKLLQKADTEESKYEKRRLLDEEKNENKNHLTISNDEIAGELINDEESREVKSIFGEKIEEQTERLKKFSPFSHCSTWKLFQIIVKSGEDLRQEQFATQLISEFNQIFHLENVEMWLKPYEILSTGHNVGIIESVPNSISIDYLKRKATNFSTLSQFFVQYFGNPNSNRYKIAIENFTRSLAGYSLVCYFLQIKDRHNGNILLDDKGHIIHIDFGFMLSNAPGKGIQFEKAPFKLTNEFVDVIGGVHSANFSKFRKLLYKGFIAASKHYEKIIMLVEMMYCGHGKNMPCFIKGQETIEELRQRFIPRLKMKNHDYIRHVDILIESSIDNWRTKWYDKFQYCCQGIFY